MTETPPFSLKTLLWGLVIPLLVGLLIMLFPTIIAPATADFVPFPLHTAFAQMVIYGVPLLLGLNWNKWAGGASGFLLGTLWYISNAGYYNAFTGGNPNMFGDLSFVGYIVTGILIGYIGGALCDKSYSFKRMLGAGLTAAITVAIFQFILNATVAVEFARNMTLADPGYALFITVLPNVILGLIIPLIAKISYGSELSHP